MKSCYYCGGKAVTEDAKGLVYTHKPECPILELEVNAMVDKTPMSMTDPLHVTISKMRKFLG